MPKTATFLLVPPTLAYMINWPNTMYGAQYINTMYSAARDPPTFVGGTSFKAIVPARQTDHHQRTSCQRQMMAHRGLSP